MGVCLSNDYRNMINILEDDIILHYHYHLLIDDYHLQMILYYHEDIDSI